MTEVSQYSPLPNVPNNLWEASKKTTPTEKNNDYPPMEFLLEKIAKRVADTGSFEEKIAFEDTGQELAFKCNRDEVEISSGKYKIKLGRTLVDPETNGYAIAGTIVYKINEQYDQNLFASSSFKYIIRYFEEVNPYTEIIQFSAFWSMKLDLRDNYKAFTQAEGNDQQKALATPSGKMAYKAGFTEVEYLGQDINDGSIAVLFKKSKATSST